MEKDKEAKMTDKEKEWEKRKKLLEREVKEAVKVREEIQNDLKRLQDEIKNLRAAMFRMRIEGRIGNPEPEPDQPEQYPPLAIEVNHRPRIIFGASHNDVCILGNLKVKGKLIFEDPDTE